MFTLLLQVLGCVFMALATSASYGWLLRATFLNVVPPKNRIGKHRDTIVKRAPMAGPMESVHPSKIYWYHTMNEGRYHNGIRSESAWGNPKELIPLLARGWNNVFAVPVIKITDLPETGGILSQMTNFTELAKNERMETLNGKTPLINSVPDEKLNPYGGHERDDYMGVMFQGHEPVEVEYVAIGGFRRGSVIADAIGLWCRLTKQAYTDYLVKVELCEPMNDVDLLVKLLADNDEAGKQDYTWADRAKLAKEYIRRYREANPLTPPKSGEDLRRLLGIKSEFRTQWQKLEKMLKLDEIRSDLNLIERICQLVPKDWAYVPGTGDIPWTKLPGYQLFATLCGEEKEKDKTKTFPYDVNSILDKLELPKLSLGEFCDTERIEAILAYVTGPKEVDTDQLTDTTYLEGIHKYVNAGQHPTTKEVIPEWGKVIRLMSAIRANSYSQIINALGDFTVKS